MKLRLTNKKTGIIITEGTATDYRCVHGFLRAANELDTVGRRVTKFKLSLVKLLTDPHENQG